MTIASSPKAFGPRSIAPGRMYTLAVTWPVGTGAGAGGPGGMAPPQAATSTRDDTVVTRTRCLVGRIHLVGRTWRKSVARLPYFDGFAALIFVANVWASDRSES